MGIETLRPAVLTRHQFIAGIGQGKSGYRKGLNTPYSKYLVNGQLPTYDNKYITTGQGAFGYSSSPTYRICLTSSANTPLGTLPVRSVERGLAQCLRYTATRERCGTLDTFDLENILSNSGLTMPGQG